MGHESHIETVVIPATLGMSEITMYVTVPGDTSQEAIANLSKAISRLDKLIVKRREKLANENFVSRAPAAIVQKERDRLALMERQHWVALRAHRNLVSEN